MKIDHTRPAKLRPGVSAEMVTEVESAAGMVRAAVTAVALMQTGELSRDGARTVVHQLDLAIKQCHEFAARPDWGHGREAFLEYAEMMSETRDEARELIP